MKYSMIDWLIAGKVMDFLETLAERIKPRVERDLADIREVKLKHGSLSEVRDHKSSYKPDNSI